MMNESHKKFIGLIQKAARTRSVVDVFGDAVHLMAQALWRPLALSAADEVEADWQQTRDRFTDAEYGCIVEAFSLVMTELALRREEFLGDCLESIGAANKHNGQFLTPRSVARMMARIAVPEKPEGIVTLADPACGASVLLIEQAERLLEKGVPQKDILIQAGDIDRRACDMSYIELSLLGYAARVDHVNALTMTQYSPTRYTLGYFLHAMPDRLKASREEAGAGAEPKAAPAVAGVTQGVFDFG